MSNTTNSQILDGMAERVNALEEVLKPSAFKAFKSHLEHLISNGEWEHAEHALSLMEDAQDV